VGRRIVQDDRDPAPVASAAWLESIASPVLEGLILAAIRWGSVAPLVLAAAAIMGSPGPATISLVAVVAAYGVRRSLPYVCGLVAGSGLVLVAVASGVTATLLAVPALRSLLIAGSAAYVLWLAYHIATAPPLSAQRAAADAPSLAGGTVLGVANPKGWVAMAAVFASARLADTAATDAAAKTAVLAVMIVLIMTVWLIAGASLAPMLRDPQRARIVNAALAAALVGATAAAVLH
jgi:threonine/homoserine/homoserine lactone efflux protein